MTSTSIYQPFTYCITFIPTGQRYYGVRYAKNCHPEQFWESYFTSSKTINDLISEFGKDIFTFQIRKLFLDKESAISWESKFLSRIDARNNPNWLNRNNGDEKFINLGGYTGYKQSDSHKFKRIQARLFTLSLRTDREIQLAKEKAKTEYSNRSENKKSLRNKSISNSLTNRSEKEKQQTKELRSIVHTNIWHSKSDIDRIEHGKKISLGMSNISQEEKLKTTLKRKNTNLSKSQEEKLEIDKKRSYSAKLTWYSKSEEEKLAWSKLQSENKMGVSHPIVTCPHCEKSGGNRNMKRWHFDNCKYKLPDKSSINPISIIVVADAIKEIM